ncbi:MAG: hypothetical protein IJX78_06480 [Bacilli bacterium]|nr:hypothetical protein [Bacilli bacterium]
MNEKTMNGKKAFKIALPVILGLVLVLLITLTVSIVSRPDFNASLENPNGAYLKLEDYVITNEKMYINLRYNYGVSDMVTYVDKILLDDIKVDRNSEEYLEVKNKLIYGEDHEELAATEKAELLEEYETNLKIAGYKTEEAVNAHFDLEYKRTVYAKQAYKEWVKENPYDDETLESAYLEMNAAKYNDSVDAIVVTFDSEQEALAVLEMFGVDTENLSSSQNWINKEKNAQRLAWLEEIEDLKAKVESAANGTEKDVLNAKIAEIEKDILALGVKNINNIVYFTELEIQQIFVDMYNFMNAFFNGGDVSKYYDENGKLNPKYNILVEDVHYEVVEKEINENDEKVTKKVIQIIGNVEEAKKNANCKLTYTEEEAKAINSTLNTTLFTTLKLGEDYDFRESYTKMPSGFSDGSAYFLAVLLGKYEAPDLEYDFFDEEDDDLTDPGQELLDEITAYLVEEKFDDNIITQMLLELRAKNGLVIYDNYIEAAYKAAWDYLYGTTLKIEDYPEFEVNKKNSKTLVFTLTPENGETIEMNAQDFFELLNEAHGPQTALSMMSNYFVLSNPEYNKLYNHVTGEIYDKEAFKDAVANELKNIKYYFNAGYYASSGFDASYGWNNFLRDYLRMDDEYELILNAAGMEDAFKKFYETQYTYESVLKEMKEIWENDYYALSIINVIVFTDYNHDGSADNYELDEEKVNEFWTEEQEALAKELIEKIYAAAPATGEDGLYKQLVAVVKEYNEATYNDEVWGQYKQAGLKVKPEDAQDYTNSSSLVQEFLDKMAEVYNDIEREGRTGIEFDAPYLVEGSFVTSYGYHKIAITKTTDRTYVTEEVDKTLGYEELRDSQLALLTENVYKLYLEMQEDDYEENKEEILKELGFDADYELDDKLNKAIETYYVPAVEALEDEHAMDIVFSNIRETAVKNGVYVFTNAADKEYYFEVETIVRADLEKEHADHE